MQNICRQFTARHTYKGYSGFISQIRKSFICRFKKSTRTTVCVCWIWRFTVRIALTIKFIIIYYWSNNEQQTTTDEHSFTCIRLLYQSTFVILFLTFFTHRTQLTQRSPSNCYLFDIFCHSIILWNMKLKLT